MSITGLERKLLSPSLPFREKIIMQKLLLPFKKSKALQKNITDTHWCIPLPKKPFA